MTESPRRTRGGLFVSLEGGEGSGKSTLLERLRDFLEGEGLDVLVSREPGGPPIAEAVREILLDRANTAMDPLTELFLYLASRRQNVMERIRPHLEAGGAVICDRFLDASVAYQGGGRRLGVQLVDRLNTEAVGGTRPDITFLIDLDPQLGLARGPGENGDRIEREAADFHRRVREAYLAAAEREPERFVLLDGSRTREEVAEVALAALRNLLARKA